jgi:hypothetical protein
LFARYGDRGGDVILRNGVEFSVHQAGSNAEIEVQEGTIATHIIDILSTFFNPLEPDNAALMTRLRSLRHDIGLLLSARTRPHSDSARTDVEQVVLASGS